MLRHFVAPVGVEPGSTSAGADDGEDFRGVVRQIQFNGAKRFDNIGDDRVKMIVYCLPRDIIGDRPTPFSLRHIEEGAVESPETSLQCGWVCVITGLRNDVDSLERGSSVTCQRPCKTSLPPNPKFAT